METIKLAIQKKGRLSEKSIELIRKCGINMNVGTGLLKSPSSNFPIEFLYLRDDDIPEYVANGVADIGIVGKNEVVEKNKEVTIVEDLGFSKCRLSIAVLNNVKYSGSKDLSGLTIATSYPRILKNYLDENNVEAAIHEISGSVEIAPALGLADAICDIVSTGSTLLSNGLKEVEQIFLSTAELIKNPQLSSSKNKLLNKLILRIRSVLCANSNKYILLNVPNDKIDQISSLIPGMKSPTILPLANRDWSSMHSVVEENRFWSVLEQLKELGAQGILIIPIENMIV